MKKIAFAACLLASIITTPAWAQDVAGTLTFGSPGGTNYFDPAQGYVPAGFGNTGGTTVAIGAGVEFGFNDGANLDTADFTANSLTISDQTFSSASPFFMTFFSSLSGFFDNAAFVTNGFSGTLSVTGNTLTFAAPQFDSVGTRTSIISFAGGNPGAVPEPATWAMMLMGFGAMGVALRRRRKLTHIAQLA